MGKIPWSQVEKMSYPLFANINKPFQKQNRYSFHYLKWKFEIRFLSIFSMTSLLTLRKQNMIWFNSKTFLQLIAKHFLRSHKLHEIFDRNTVKVSYSCMTDMPKITKGLNKTVTSKPRDQTAKCNCRKVSRMSNGRELLS